MVGETKAYQNGCLMPNVYINNAKTETEIKIKVLIKRACELLNIASGFSDCFCFAVAYF